MNIADQVIVADSSSRESMEAAARLLGGRVVDYEVECGEWLHYGARMTFSRRFAVTHGKRVRRDERDAEEGSIPVHVPIMNGTDFAPARDVASGRPFRTTRGEPPWFVTRELERSSGPALPAGPAPRALPKLTRERIMDGARKLLGKPVIDVEPDE